MIYFDNAATTLHKPAAVSAAAAQAMQTLASPGRGSHRAAETAAALAYNCRELAARYFNVASPECVVFTQNATHALNIAIRALAKQGKRAVISGWEHNSVRRPVIASGANVTVACGRLFDADAVLNDFYDALTPGTAVCAVNHVSNVFGFVLPIEEISRLCRERSIPLIVDASQSAGVLSVDFVKLNAEFVAMPGHKGLYGPQGTGLLLSARERDVLPLIFGGSGSDSKREDMPEWLPDRLEAGTHNMPGIAGLMVGLEFVSSQPRILEHERNLLNIVADGLAELPGVKVYHTNASGVQTGVLSFNINGIDPQIVADTLSRQGVCVRAGQHCAPLAHQTAGTAERGTVRASFSAFNTHDEARLFVDAVAAVTLK
jgi:cysteine desulfurase family protein